MTEPEQSKRQRIGPRLLSIAAFVATLGATVVAAPVFAQQKSFITIGTAGVTGVYYPTGGAICRLVNKGRKEHSIRCSVESTAGSVYNLNNIMAGDFELAVAQSDLLYHAYKGSGEFENAGANAQLRTLFTLYPESFTVVARADAGIETFTDLKGKRVNIGNPGSGQRGSMEVLMNAYGWSTDDFALASELGSDDQAKALCDNELDAIIFTVGHPNGSIKEATTSCETILIDVSGSEIDALVASSPYYRQTVIPGKLYRGSANDVKTFGTVATIVSSTSLSDDVAYRVTKAVFDKLDGFKKLHPALENLTPEDMVRSELSAPIHSGAAKYFEEAGLK